MRRRVRVADHPAMGIFFQEIIMGMNRKAALSLGLVVLGLGLFPVGSSLADNFRHHEEGFLPLKQIHDKLHLTADQEKTWQTLAQESKDARKASWEQHKEMRAQLKKELGKTEPDFAGLAARSDQLADERTRNRRQLRDQWLKFYAGLSVEQKAVVRDTIKSRLEKAGKRGERGQRRWHEENPS